MTSGTAPRFEEGIAACCRREPRIAAGGYELYFAGLGRALQGERRHCSPAEIMNGMVGEAVASYGLLAPAVLEHFGLVDSAALETGLRVLFETGMLRAREEDLMPGAFAGYSLERVRKYAREWLADQELRVNGPDAGTR